MSFAQVLKVAPLGFWAAAAHAGAVVAMSAGAVSFGQIVKAAEPVFAVIVGSLLYGKSESKAKIAMLVPIIVRCLACALCAPCVRDLSSSASRVRRRCGRRASRSRPPRSPPMAT
jgi:uncharacterized membrane protein